MPDVDITQIAKLAVTQNSRNNTILALKRFSHNRLALVGAIIIFIFMVMAIAAPIVAPYPRDRQVIADRLKPPSTQYWMGTDALGRDVFSRAVWASRVSMPIGFLAMAISLVIGVFFGLIAGYYGGWIDNVIMRITDLFLSFPIIFLLLTIAALFGPSVQTIIWMLGLTSWGGTARIMRGQVLALREMLYVDAARAIGAKDSRIIFRHILINSLSVITVNATLMVAYAILIEGSLSFLGLGVQPPLPSWGNMMADGEDVLQIAWWISTFPGIFLLLVVISFNLLGEGLRDMFDPSKQNR
jgi:peptide/nickel transport system permease protein